MERSGLRERERVGTPVDTRSRPPRSFGEEIKRIYMFDWRKTGELILCSFVFPLFNSK